MKGVGSHTDVLSRPDAHTAELELTGFESRYRLTLVLERDEGPRPKTRVFLDRSEDDCGATNLFVESKTGNVLVRKGEDPVDVFIKDDRYHWHCGDLGNDDSSNAPDATNVAVTRRDATGDRIRWEWFAEHTVSPDYP